MIYALDFVILFLVSLIWGLNASLVKISIIQIKSPLILAFWQAAVGGICTLLWVVISRGWKNISHENLLYGLVLALLHGIGANILANIILFHLNITVISVIFGCTPILTYLSCHILQYDRIRPSRSLGILLGFSSICLLLTSSFSVASSDIFWIVIAFLVPITFCVINLVITIWSKNNSDYIELTLTRYSFSSLLLLLIILIQGNSLVPPEMNYLATLSISSIGILEVTSQALFILLIARAGPVFGSQTSYIATVFTACFGVLIFSERPSTALLLSITLMVVGVMLIHPMNPFKQVSSQKY
ncbi:MAG: hypothetical protein CMF42_00810 [Legionellales bacterium]|nr:hypothetical protein [Legionellales bacterium]OUX68300.1 MAG: hypothetical protein CBD38_00355 [bacterium TMED178]|tara:strand:- start:993 stop:1895 length:903 start_codon:yes stop_codon:yes gene_type:complete